MFNPTELFSPTTPATASGFGAGSNPPFLASPLTPAPTFSEVPLQVLSNISGREEYLAGRQHFQAADYAVAYSHFQNAALQHYPPAYLYLLRLDRGGYIPQVAEAVISHQQHLQNYFNWFVDEAKKLMGDAEFNLGYFYHSGLIVPQNLGQAFHHFLSASEKNDAEALFYLSKYYQIGAGGAEQNVELAQQYRQRATDLGYRPAL